MTPTSAYLLAAASLGTVYGKVSDIVGTWDACHTAKLSIALTNQSDLQDASLFCTRRSLSSWYARFSVRICSHSNALPDRLCIMWCRSEHDLARCVSSCPRYWWWRNYPNGPDHHFGYCLAARVRVIFGLPLSRALIRIVTAVANSVDSSVPLGVLPA